MFTSFPSKLALNLNCLKLREGKRAGAPVRPSDAERETARSGERRARARNDGALLSTSLVLKRATSLSVNTSPPSSPRSAPLFSPHLSFYCFLPHPSLHPQRSLRVSRQLPPAISICFPICRYINCKIDSQTLRNTVLPSLR